MPLRRASALRPARPPSPRRTKSSVSHPLQCCHILGTLTRSCASYTTMVRISHAALMVLHASELSISPSIHPQYCTVLRLTIRRPFVFLGSLYHPCSRTTTPLSVGRKTLPQNVFFCLEICVVSPGPGQIQQTATSESSVAFTIP